MATTITYFVPSMDSIFDHKYTVSFPGCLIKQAARECYALYTTKHAYGFEIVHVEGSFKSTLNFKPSLDELFSKKKYQKMLDNLLKV